MKRTLLILAITVASAICQQRLVKGCFKWDKTKNTCTACYRRKITSTGCGTLLSVQDNCLLHAETPGQPLFCQLCRQGYAPDENRQCQPLNIFNCAVGGIYQKQHTCDICGNGQFPVANGSTTVCAPDPNPIPNCLWGTVLNGKKCLRCGAGYVVKSDASGCVAQNATNLGALRLNNDGSLYTCDVFAGYSMQKNGQCKFIKQE